MKKIILVVLASLLCFSLFSETAGPKPEDQDLTYINLPIVRVYDHKDAFVVHYLKTNGEMAQAFVPKEWFSTEKVNKSRVRPLSKGVGPYMTVINEKGNFVKVYLNMPISRRDPAWGILSRNIDVASKMNTETLDIQY